MDITLFYFLLIICFIFFILLIKIFFLKYFKKIKININKEKTILKVKKGNSLLTNLQKNNINIKSVCGGRGLCGTCRIKAISTTNDLTEKEFKLLNKNEINQGIRLACQLIINKNINIEIDDNFLSVKKFIGTVKSIKNLTEDIKLIKILLNKNNTIEFKSGQYIQLQIPAYETLKKPTQRAYSISSTPKENNLIELIVKLLPGGISTTYIFNYLKESQIVNFTGPFGDFYLNNSKADIIFVAGGSGMAPIKSIIFDMLNKNILNRNIWYFFGAKSLKDLYYIDYFKNIEKKFNNFKFIPALSDPDLKDNWNGEIGLITDVLDNYLKKNINIKSNKEGYLCGNPAMINACIKVMKNHGILEKYIFYDKFA